MSVVSPPRTGSASGAAGDGSWTEAASRAPGRRWSSRVSAGHLLMVVAGLAGAVLSVAVLRDRPEGVRIAVADGEIRAGDVVAEHDFRTELVEAPTGVLRTLVATRDVRDVRGFVATSTIRDGEPVLRGVLRHQAAPRGLRAMSIPIDASRAVGGRLAAGDRIDVLFAGAREASIIIGDARVIAVDEKGRGGIGETSSPFTVTIAVDARESQLLAAAIADGDLSIARTTGSSSSAGTAPLSLDRSDGERVAP